MYRITFLSVILISVYLFANFSDEKGICSPKNIERNLKIPDSSHVQILTTKDGSITIGKIIQVGDNEIKFETNMGKMTVLISQIKEIKTVPASLIKNGRYWFPAPNTTRLFFSSTGRMLPRGDGFFSDVYIFFPGAAYGITDNVTIGGGMSLFPGVGVNKQIFYFTPKIGIKATKNLALATGVLLIKLPEFFDDESHNAGVLYGVGTYGTPDRSLTFGLGYGFVDGNIAEKPMLLIGGEKRLTRRIAFVSENWIFPGMERPTMLYGFRFFGRSISVDLAFLNVVGEEGMFPGVPYIDFVFKF